jgi:amino acid transporter
MSARPDLHTSVLAARRRAPTTRTTTVQSSLKRRQLGTWQLFVLGIAAITPLSIVAGSLPLAYGQVKLLGTPIAYVIVAAILAVFAVGLAAMARHVPNSGAFYSYVTAGLGRPLGLATAAIALAAYATMLVGVYGAFGPTTATALDLAGIHAFPGLWMLLGWLAVGALAQLRVTVNARILGLLIAAEIVIVLVFDTVMLAHPHDGIVSFDTLNPMLLANPTGMAALVGAFTGLTGFEIPLAFARVTRDPRRTMVRAIVLILLVVAGLYGGSAWAMSVIAGPDNIIAVAGQHLRDLFFVLPGPYLPTVVHDLAVVLFATSLFAGLLAFHSTWARYALTLAREGVLPRWLAITRADEVPVTASATLSALGLIVLTAVVASGADPTVDLLFFGTITGGLGILIMMAIAALAVVRYFHHNGHGENLWRRRIAPTLSAVLIVILATVSIVFFGQLLGTNDPLKAWAGPAGYLILAVLGVGYAHRLRRRRPHVYAAIGTGDGINRALPAAEPADHDGDAEDPR